MKVSNKIKKQIIKDRKAGMMVGQLSWKYDLTIKQIMKILGE